jgi:hypothetical protein
MNQQCNPSPCPACGRQRHYDLTMSIYPQCTRCNTLTGMAIESRSQLRRIAAQQGKQAPEFIQPNTEANARAGVLNAFIADGIVVDKQNAAGESTSPAPPSHEDGGTPSVAPDVTYERGRYSLTIYRAPSCQWSWSVKLDGEPVVSGAGYDIRDDAQMDGLEEFERHAPSPCPPTKTIYIEVPPVPPLERTPVDYVIEHAEYMAVGGEMLLAAINEAHEVGERYDNEEATEEEVAIVVEVLSEKMKGLLKGIYEFRKRRDRVISLPAEKGTLSGKEQERLDRLERRAEHLRGRIAAAEFEHRDLAFDKMELSALLWVVRKIRALTVNV